MAFANYLLSVLSANFHTSLDIDSFLEVQRFCNTKLDISKALCYYSSKALISRQALS